MNLIIETLNALGGRFAGFALAMFLQSAVLIVLLLALDWALRTRVRATIRYAVWMLMLVKLVLPPSLALPTGLAYWLPAPGAARASSPATVLPAASAVSMAISAENPAGGIRVPADLAPPAPMLERQAVYFLLWLSVAMGMGTWILWRLRLVFGLVAQGVAAPEAVCALLESCRRQLGIKRLIRVRCAKIGTPAICGVWRPTILVPSSVLEKLSEAEMRQVLLHELAHFRRGDVWVSQAQILLQVFYWYNPLVWLANARIQRTREQAVDEAVLVEIAGEAQAYSATLLHVAKLSLARPMSVLGLVGILEPGGGLTRRIAHMMNRPQPRTAAIGARALAALLLLGLVSLPMAYRSRAQSTTPETPPTAGPPAAVLRPRSNAQPTTPATLPAQDEMQPLDHDIPLTDGIRRANELFPDVQPLTEDEVVSAVRAIKLEFPDIKPDIYETYMRVVNERVLPKGMYFSRITAWNTEYGRFQVDWKDLCLEGRAATEEEKKVMRSNMSVGPYKMQFSVDNVRLGGFEYRIRARFISSAGN